MKAISVATIAIAISALAQTAQAGVHTWIPAGSASTTTGAERDIGTIDYGAARTDSDLQIVIVTATRIYWGPGSFDSPISEVPNVSSFNGLSFAINSARERAVNLANACKNPLISAAAKSTASTSTTESRWLAAQEMYNSIQASNLWSMYQNAYGGISIIVNGQSYRGFKVKYVDGATETWVVTPNAATSSVKLFDTPAPDSLKPGTPDC